MSIARAGGVVVACAVAACASGRTPRAPAADPYVPFVPVWPREAPRCAPAGPHVDVWIGGMLQGKPPMTTYDVGLRVRNPSAEAVWFLFDLPRELPEKVSRVELERAEGNAGEVWRLDGLMVRAVHAAPKADFTMRVRVSTSERDPTFVSFARDLRLDGRPIPDWLGRSGSPIGGGRIDVDGRPTEIVAERHLEDELNGARLGVELVCSQRVDFHDESLWHVGRASAPGRQDRDVVVMNAP
jgi:hypothetical protein